MNDLEQTWRRKVKCCCDRGPCAVDRLQDTPGTCSTLMVRAGSGRSFARRLIAQVAGDSTPRSRLNQDLPGRELMSLSARVHGPICRHLVLASGSSQGRVAREPLFFWCSSDGMGPLVFVLRISIAQSP
jgi:hypothetical protein